MDWSPTPPVHLSNRNVATFLIALRQSTYIGEEDWMGCSVPRRRACRKFAHHLTTCLGAQDYVQTWTRFRGQVTLCIPTNILQGR